MKQARAQQVINRLAKRWEKARKLTVKCMLGREPLRRRGGGCSVCRARQEFELDQAAAQLINAKVFKGTGVCPYQVITSHLVAGLVFCLWVVLSHGLPAPWIGLAVVIALSSTALELWSPRGTDDFTMATGNALICWAFGALVA